MKTFQQIQEERGERAFKQAMSMGLKYGGFGYWKDPQTNETVYKTENDTLVKVEPREESELAAKGGPDGSAGRPDAMDGAAGAAGGGGMAGAGGMLQMPGGGLPGSGIQGAPMPGEEKVGKDRSWEPGPDGDTCVGPEAEEPGKVPEDSFVGRTNFLKWRAGPDGDNMNTVSLGMVKEQISQIREEEENSGPPGAQTLMRQAMGAQKRPATDAPFGKTIKDARGAVDQMKKGGHDVALGNQIASMMRIQNRQAAPDPLGTNIKPPSPTDIHNVEADKQVQMHKKLVKLPAVAKDAEAVKMMNEEVRGLVQDPNYKMDQFDDDEDGENYMDEGAFGQVFEDRNGNVIKKGQLGPKELHALHAMKDNPAFPNLINAQFDEPFKHKSSVYNNPMNVDNERRGQGEEDYWNPDDQSEWDKQFPTASGTYAMSQAKGSPLYNALGMDEETKDKMMRNFWRARGDLHKAGFSHNDMHGGNVFVDEETGEVQIIDLGLAKDNKLSALMEGLGGLDFEEGQDYQLTGDLSGSKFSERMQEMSVKNREKIEQTIMDSFDLDDMDDEEAEDAYIQGAESLREMMTGDIRMREDDFDRIKEQIPYLADDKNVEKLIKMLYEEIGGTELQDRMSDAFTKKQKDSKVIRAANLVRKRQGQDPIKVTNKNVIPPENMDFDD